jgi:hypothetical protein
MNMQDYGSYRNARAITTSDTVALNPVPEAIYVGVTGNIVMRLMGDGTDVTFKGAVAGSILRVRPQFIRATSTTATDLVALT